MPSLPEFIEEQRKRDYGKDVGRADFRRYRQHRG